jgi:hypothetical protein
MFNHAVQFKPTADRPLIPGGGEQSAVNLLRHRPLTPAVLAADDGRGGFMRRELSDLLAQFPVMREQVQAAVLLMLLPGGPDQEAPVELGDTSEDSEIECWEPNAAEQQQLREEEAARQVERDTILEHVAIDAYTARNFPCCHGDGPENHSPEQQELIDFISTDGIQCEFDGNGIQISHTFHPQELFDELSIHLATNAFNDYNTEELVRWKIQYLYNHDILRTDSLESAD